VTNQFELEVDTQDRSTIEITNLINQYLKDVNIGNGLLNIFVKHTSASLVITGNEDPNLLDDIENYLQKTIIDGDPSYKHNNEGDFDTSGHIRTILTGESKTIPFIDNALAFGQYQGLFLYEHRAGKNNRKLIITIL